MTELTQEELTRLLDYDPETGVFRWKVSCGRSRVGSIAGAKGLRGMRITLKGISNFSRRLAWFYIYGELPRNNLFVKNGNCMDDRISNIGILPDKPQKLTHEYLKKCIEYNPDNGEFRWKITESKNRYGNDAFCISNRDNNDIILRTQILGKAYPTSYLIVFWMTGYMPSPTRVIINKDNNVLNLKWENIKIGSRREAQMKRRNFGRCAMKGVYFIASCQKYRATIRTDGKQKYLGLFKTEAEAHTAYMKAAREHYGELANDGYQHAMYEMDWEEIEQPATDVAEELLASAEEAVGIINGTVKPSKVWVPPSVTEEHPVDF